jgi:hypothetical protein
MQDEDIAKRNMENSINQWAEIARKNAEREISRAIFIPILLTSPTVDRAASWLLAGCGATAGLLISNLAAASTKLEHSNLRLLLFLLLAAFLVGLVEKLKAVLIQITCEMEDAMMTLTKEALREHIQQENEIRNTAEAGGVTTPNMAPDFMHPINELMSICPWYLKWHMQRQVTKGLKDPLYGYKKAIKSYHIQCVAASVEALLFMAAIVLVAVTMKVA